MIICNLQSTLPPPAAAAKPPAGRADWRWPLALFGLAFAIRLVYALQIPFPPLDDPAYYVQGARSLFTSHPLQMALVWNYHPQPGAVLHPGFDFWMPLTSFAIAGFMAVLGDTPLAAQLPSVLAGSVLAALTYYLGRRWQLPGWLGGLAGLYIALNPLLAYQSAVPDSQMLYAALVTGALLVWPNQPHRRRAFVLGLLIGLAYLARSHALLLVATWGLVTLWRLWRQAGQRRPLLLDGLFTLLGLALTTGPWLLRNLLTFGFVNSPAGLESALIYDYATLFNYQTPINFSTFLNLGAGKIIEARVIALGNAWLDVLSVLFLPAVLLPGVGLFLLWRQRRETGPALLYALLLSLGLPLIFVAASATGSFYHSSGSLAAVGALGYAYLLWRVAQFWRRDRPKRPSLWPALLGAVAILLAFQYFLTLPQTLGYHQFNQVAYARLDQWLRANGQGQPVIADEPSTLNYATGLPALRLPADEPLPVLKTVADRYGARYIVVTHEFGRYPALLDNPASQQFPLVYSDPDGGFKIYRVESARLSFVQLNVQEQFFSPSRF